jgi:hypothetical protein
MPAAVLSIPIAALKERRSHGKVIYVLSAFGDESSDETHQRVFAVAAIFGEQQHWDELEVKWRERTGDIDFHAADCDSDAGPYATSSHAENKALYRDLTQLLVDSALLGYGVALDLISQNKYMPELLPESPYYKCFAEVVIFFAHRAAFYIPRERIKFTFDRRLETQFNATALYDYLAKLPEWDDRSYLHEEIAFASRRSVGVQAADLWAREVMKRLDNEIGPKERAVRRSFEVLENTERFGGRICSGEYFKGLQQAVHAMDISDGPGAFRHTDYKEWLTKYKQLDNYATRLRYLTQHDAIQRASGSPTHLTMRESGPKDEKRSG